jgi:hypothetical protein
VLVSIDVIVGLCKLGDLGSRAVTLQETDQKYMSKLIKFEDKRQKLSEQELAIRHQHQHLLEHKDEENLIDTALGSFKSQIMELSSSLQDAKAAEENALKVLFTH